MRGKKWTVGLIFVASLAAQPVTVRHQEGLVRGFLTLRNQDDDIVAQGDSTQTACGDRVTNRLVYHFKDGSLQDETAVFSQTGHLRLLAYHLVQKGAAFKRPLLDLSVNASTGQVAVHYQDDDGKDKTENKRMELPADLANGMVPTLLKNLPPGAPSVSASMVVSAPKPMLVKLAISAEGQDSFSTAGAVHKATRYLVKVEIGGVRGVIAPLVGKQPADTRVWVMSGKVPAFIKSEGPFYEGGPIWQTELTSPVWPRTAADTADRKK